MTDEQLIKDCIQNKRGAMDLLYKRFATRMYSVCLRFAKSRMEADDLMQEGFIKVYLNLGMYRGEGSLDGWIRRIVVNNCINVYRQKTIFFEDIEKSKEAHLEQFEDDVVSSLSSQDLLDMIQQLPEGYRMIFNLYVIEGYQHKEIGELLNISENTSKSQLMKARRALQEKIMNTVYEKAF